MPRKNIHPKMNKVTVKFPDGTSIFINSTYKKSDTIFAEFVIDKHPAWMGKLSDGKDSVNKKVKDFMSKFGSKFENSSDNSNK